jgi:hypothetical protein
MNRFYDYLQRKSAQHGNKFNPSDLESADKNAIMAYDTGKKVVVFFRNSKGKLYDIKSGYIGITTGWKPCFLLMRTKRSMGSSWTIGPYDRVEEYFPSKHRGYGWQKGIWGYIDFEELGKKNMRQVRSLETGKPYTVMFRGRKFTIRSRKDIMRLLRTRDRLPRRR